MEPAGIPVARPRTPSTCPPPGSNGVLGVFTPVRYQLRQEGIGTWRRRDSNPRPLPCHGSALPAELQPHGPGPGCRTPCLSLPKRAGQPSPSSRRCCPPAGPCRRRPGVLLMPSTVELRINNVSGRSRDEKQGRQDSNLQPSVLETGALPVELRPYGVVRVTKKPPYPWRGGRLRSLRWRYSRRHPGFQFCSLAQRSWARPIEGSTTPPRGMNRVDSVETYCNTGNSSGWSG